MQKARIRLSGTDFEKIEMVCDRIKEIAERTASIWQVNTAAHEETCGPRQEEP